jgi:aminoglycoside phosphotransferase (APT) family kinase protein
MGIKEKLGKAWEKAYQHYFTTAITAGTILGVAKGAEIYQYMGGDYIDTQAGVTLHNVDAKTVAIYTITRTIMWSAMVGIPLWAIHHNEGLRNFWKKFRFLSTSKDKPELAKKRLEDLCQTTRITDLKIWRAWIAANQDCDMNTSIEYIRRATIDSVREEYRQIKGRAEYRKRDFFRRWSDKRLGHHQRDRLAELEFAARFMTENPETEEAKTFMIRFFHGPGQATPENLRTVANEARVMKTHLDAFVKAREGKLEEADRTLAELCDAEPRVTNRCVYGSFLDTVAAIDEDYGEKARDHWSGLIRDIITAPGVEGQFRQLPGSKNEVLEFADSETKRSMLIVKRSEQREGLEREFRIAQFLYDFLGQKGIVPEALTLAQHGDHFYFVQKRVLGRTLQEMLKTGDDRTQVITALLETLDQYQRRAQQNKGVAGRYDIETGKINYPAEFNTKFVEMFRGQLPDFDFTKVNERMEQIYRLLEQQRQGGCHGDLHAENGIFYDGKKVCIIDSEKLFWGARVLDWANFILHTKMEQGIDIDDYKDNGYDYFRKSGMSRDEYLAAYHSGAVFKAAHLAGSVSKYSSSGAISPVVGRERVLGYLDEAVSALTTLKELVPLKNRQAAQELAEEYAKIRRALSA